MKVTVLGCSGSVPGPDSPASGYLIEADGYRLVLDLGHGAFGALQRYVAPTDVDAIVISHLHADHCIDLTAYVVALRYGGDGYRAGGPEARIPLVGPSGTRDRIDAAYDPLARKLGLQELFGFATPAAGELGPVRAVLRHGEPPDADLGGAHHRRGPRRWCTPPTPARARSWSRSPTAPTCSCARPRSARTTSTSPTCT